ncbi:MAG: cation diffusion facilitator family transporter [Candidatus Kapaibacterium sp.]
MAEITSNNVIKKKSRYGLYVAWTSIIGNGILFVIKYLAGVEANSIAMQADAWHSLSDTFSSVIVIIGFWMAARPADREHPFGHGRAESVAAIVIATILGVVGINFMVDSIGRFSDAQSAEYSTFAIIIFSISIIVKEILAQVSFHAGKKLKSESLRADAWHHRSDAITTLLIVVGSLIGSQWWWLDSVLGIIVSLVLLYATFEIMRTAMSVLMGKKPDDAMIQQIKDNILKVDGCLDDVHNIKVHSYGDVRELIVDVRMPPDMSVFDAHELATVIERQLYEKMELRTTVHIEPHK